MIYRLDPRLPFFPDPEEAEPNGLIAVGGDLSPQRLVNAYGSGIFPWFVDEGGVPYWFSPDPRMVLLVGDFRESKSLRRTVRSGRFEVRVDTAFRQVMEGCARTEREGQEGTWIGPEIVSAYCELHRLGLAHSFETYCQGELVGGLYGVSLGRAFFGESMFHRTTDASKVAFVELVGFCRRHGLEFIDAQQETPHLASLGARPMARSEFLRRLREMDFETTLRGRWGWEGQAAEGR